MASRTPRSNPPTTQMEKDAIETARRGADAVWKKCKEALLAKDQELGPIKELRQRRNALAEELAG